jgi:hypothetical protein
MIVRVTDFHDLGPGGVQQRPVYINVAFIAAMEPWGSKFKVFVGRSLEYVVTAADAERLARGEEHATTQPPHDGP